jgi:hypothetical protein
LDRCVIGWDTRSHAANPGEVRYVPDRRSINKRRALQEQAMPNPKRGFLDGIRILLALFVGTAGLGNAAHAQFSFRKLIGGSGVCPAILPYLGSNQDASSALQRCIDQTPAGGQLALPPGHYTFLSPIVIHQAMTLTTIGQSPGNSPCTASDERCATLRITAAPQVRPAPGKSATMPVSLMANGIVIDHVIFAGFRKSDPGGTQAVCLVKPIRALGGGVRASGNGIQVTNSVFKNFSCYSAFEFLGGSGLRISNNIFADNGTHAGHLWADGLTIHDGSNIVVSNNQFVDNTDVQLIMGGCKNCQITGNTLRHVSGPGGGSFADLMVQAWPHATSGRYDGTTVSHNSIDCGSYKACGFGLMIGSLPWYNAPVSGGVVSDNSVVNAQLGMNVEGLSGPMQIRNNKISGDAGTSAANCGEKAIHNSVNIAPDARRFLSSDSNNDPAMKAASGDSYTNCILNYPKS